MPKKNRPKAKLGNHVRIGLYFWHTTFLFMINWDIKRLPNILFKLTGVSPTHKDSILPHQM